MAYWLDDAFDTLPAVVRAGSAAVGLYVRCGAWMARHLTDGFIPSEVAAMYGTPEWIARLVDVGLWRTVEAGYYDSLYLQLNPSAAEVEKRRAAARDKKRRQRAVSPPQSRSVSRGDRPRDGPGESRSPLPSPPSGGGARARASPAPRCPHHRGQPLDGCGLCRAEALGGDT